MAVCIGIPRGLHYYYSGDIWQNFFSNLGARVVVSKMTTREIINAGGWIDEVCLPVKVYFGHVMQLCNEVDMIFSPHLASVSRNQYTCPEMIGLPDMIKANLSPAPALLDEAIDIRSSRFSLYRAIVSLGRSCGAGPVKAFYAWLAALREGMRKRREKWTEITRLVRPRIALIGHPYILYDDLVSMGLLQKLTRMGMNVVTPGMLAPGQIRAGGKQLEKKIFWSYCHDLVGGALTMMRPPAMVDGAIFVSSFACGPDSLAGEFMKDCAKKTGLPFMMLTVDEHTAEAGMITRLEAFIDMLMRR